jgi:hypothetical protein
LSYATRSALRARSGANVFVDGGNIRSNGRGAVVAAVSVDSSAGNVALANDYGSPFATSALPHALYGVYLPLVVR